MASSFFRPVRFNLGGSNTILSDYGKQIERRFSMFVEHVNEQTPGIIRQAVQATFWKSQKYCPKDTWRLVNSGYMEDKKVGKNGYFIEMGYARDGDPEYAVWVHERPAWHMAPTRWKFLQAAIEEDANEIRRRLVSGFKSVV